MLKKRLKSILGTSFAAAMLFSATPAFAADTIIADNDSDTYGNYYTGSWQYLNNGGFGDSRIHWGIGDDYYHWTFTHPKSSGWYAWSVYLNNSSFTNHMAQYYKDGSYVTGINQNTAYSGYNEISTVWLGNGSQYNFSVSAYSNGDPSYINTG
ncbi:hypothetical protein F8168_06670, partial [Bacillus cereus]